MLQGAEQFVEFVGGVEIGFQVAGTEAFAKIVEAASEEVESGGEHVAIGEDDVSPGVVWTAGQAQRVAETGTRQGDGQAVFIEAIVEERSEGDGGDLGKVRGQADGVIVLLCPDPQGTRANFFENFDEGVDSRVMNFIGVAHKGVGGVLEEVGVSASEADGFSACHGMSGKKNGTNFFDKKFGSGLMDALLGAAGICDECVRWSVVREFGKQVERVADGERDIDEIGTANGGFEGFAKTFVDGARLFCFEDHISVIPADNVHVRRVFAKGARERATDQAGTEDRYALDEMGHVS